MPAQSDGGAGVSGTFPRPETGEAAAQAGSAEELHFSFEQPVSALQAVLSGLVRRIAKLYEKQGQPQRIATVDQDATIIESHKQAAYSHYEEGRGYQPMVAVWAEADLVLADEFRDGNVPAKQEPLTCAKLAFAALPETVTRRYFGAIRPVMRMSCWIG
jgi:hypothetical protein